jgi:glycosyltransferase involved in cell wall biosynthesis
MAFVPEPITLVLVGEGTHRALIERAAEQARVSDRVRFAGAVDDEALVALYREALAVAYVPFDEDYGLATLEAFLAARPVVTARDSGGTLEFVEDDVTGLVCAPDSAALGAAIARLSADRALGRRLGDAGRTVALGITWDAVVDRLTSHG